jgi:hypothetical protein
VPSTCIAGTIEKNQQVPIRELAAKHETMLETIHTIFTDNLALVKKSTRRAS